MSGFKVQSRPGTPLYVSVRDAIRAAIERGKFQPGERLPSTEKLAAEIGASLVTVHRAMQELVAAGVLRRGQGRGTFVHEEFVRGLAKTRGLRVGVILADGDRLAAAFAGRCFDGIRSEADRLGVDLLMLRTGEDRRAECQGYLLLTPKSSQLERPVRGLRTSGAGDTVPAIIVGGRGGRETAWVDVDHAEIAKRSVSLLIERGHRAIGYVGGSGARPGEEEHWRAFLSTCLHAGADAVKGCLFRSDVLGWATDRLADAIQSSAVTAIVTQTSEAAVTVIDAARRASATIPRDLSVVCGQDSDSVRMAGITAVGVDGEELGVLAMRELAEIVTRADRSPPQLVIAATTHERGSVRDQRTP